MGMMYRTDMHSQDRRRGVVVTLIVHAAMLGCMFVFGIKYLDPPPLSGVIVAFGTDADAAGTPVREIRRQVNAQSAPSAPQVNEVADEQLSVQDEDSPLEIKKTEKKPAEKQPVKKEPSPRPAEKKASSTPSTAPKEEKPVEKPRPSDATTSALANIFSEGKDASKGDGKGTGMKGAEDGSISSSRYGVSGQGGDGNYHLSGRRAITRPKPEYTGRDQGVVRVKIQVDKNGNVISAKCSLQGTEVTDPVLLRNAERAAMQTKWSVNPTGEEIQEGYIIYNFRIGG